MSGVEALWVSFGLCSRVSGWQGGCGGGSTTKWLQLEICIGIPKRSYLDKKWVGRSQEFFRMTGRCFIFFASLSKIKHAWFWSVVPQVLRGNFPKSMTWQIFLYKWLGLVIRTGICLFDYSSKMMKIYIYDIMTFYICACLFLWYCINVYVCMCVCPEVFFVLLFVRHAPFHVHPCVQSLQIRFVEFLGLSSCVLVYPLSLLAVQVLVDLGFQIPKKSRHFTDAKLPIWGCESWMAQIGLAV